MANFSVSAGVSPAQSRTSVQGSYRVPVQTQAPVQQAPAGYGLAYQMGGPYYMYGETPRFGAYYRDGGTPPGQIHGNFAGSREGADMFGFWPTMFQRSPYATASQMYTPGLGVMPLIGYPSRYPHVIMGGYSDYGAGIANQAMGMMLPLLMMGLYRQMFPMPGAAPAAAAKGAGGGGRGGSGGGGASVPDDGAGQPSTALDENAINLNPYAAYLLSGHMSRHPELIAKYNGKPVPDDLMSGGSKKSDSASAAAQSGRPTAWQRGLRVAQAMLSPFATAGGAAGTNAGPVVGWAADHPVERRAAMSMMPGTGHATAASDASMSAIYDYLRGQ